MPLWARVLTFHMTILSACLKRIFMSPVAYFSPLSWCMAVGVAIFYLGDDWASMDSLLFCVCIICAVCLGHCLCLVGPILSRPNHSWNSHLFGACLDLRHVAMCFILKLSALAIDWNPPVLLPSVCCVKTTLSHALAHQLRWLYWEPAHKRFGNWMRTSAACPPLLRVQLPDKQRCYLYPTPYTICPQIISNT